MSVNLNETKQTVSAIAVIDLANELIERECINSKYLTEFGTDFTTLYAAWKNNKPIQANRLPEALLILLWQHADANSNDCEIGLTIGANVNLHSKGVLANWLSQCNTLAEAFSVFSQNIFLLNPSEHWHKIEEENQVKLVVRFTSSQYPVIAIDRSMAAMLSWSRALSIEGINPLAVSLERPAPKQQEKYIELFGKVTLFNQTENCLYLSKEAFNQTIKQANPYLKGILAQHAMALKIQLSQTNKRSILEAVNNLLYEDLAQFCQIGKACKKLHVSRSTLYRKLKIEGTSFTVLVKAARLNKLKDNTPSTINHDDLSEALGFQDIGSYYRFRKLHH
jgi:AraC-like DNA-binding protein